MAEPQDFRVRFGICCANDSIMLLFSEDIEDEALLSAASIKFIGIPYARTVFLKRQALSDCFRRLPVKMSR